MRQDAVKADAELHP